MQKKTNCRISKYQALDSFWFDRKLVHIDMRVRMCAESFPIDTLMVRCASKLTKKTRFLQLLVHNKKLSYQFQNHFMSAQWNYISRIHLLFYFSVNDWLRPIYTCKKYWYRKTHFLSCIFTKVESRLPCDALWDINSLECCMESWKIDTAILQTSMRKYSAWCTIHILFMASAPSSTYSYFQICKQ